MRGDGTASRRSASRPSRCGSPPPPPSCSPRTPSPPVFAPGRRGGYGRNMRGARVFFASLLLAGCVSAFPDEIVRSVNRTLTVAELRQAPAAHVNARVILGGEILATRPPGGEAA